MCDVLKVPDLLCGVSDCSPGESGGRPGSVLQQRAGQQPRPALLRARRSLLGRVRRREHTVRRPPAVAEG